MKNITKKITNNLIYVVFYSNKMNEFFNVFYDIADAIPFAKKQTLEYKNIYIIAIDECLHSLLEIMLSENCNLLESAQEADYSQEEINNIKEYIQQVFGDRMLEILENGDFHNHGWNYREYSEFGIEINDNRFDNGSYKYIVYHGENTPIVILDSLEEVYNKLLDKSHNINIVIVSDFVLQDIDILNDTKYNRYDDEYPISEYLQQKYMEFEKEDEDGNISYNIDYKDITMGKVNFNMF